jgi:hypothetical protein
MGCVFSYNDTRRNWGVDVGTFWEEFTWKTKIKWNDMQTAFLRPSFHFSLNTHLIKHTNYEFS